MKHAFSLIELSIVLVILGLLTGGILAGQSLIRAAEIRSVANEYSRWITATHTFRDKYFSIPGDMSNATSFWGAQSGATGCVNNAGTTAVATGTCDGNASGLLADAAAVNATGEIFQYWRQLAAAGLIEGSYTGLAGPTSCCTPTIYVHAVINTNVPSSKLSSAGWSLRGYNSGYNIGNTAMFDGVLGNHFYFGGSSNGGPSWSRVMKAEEVWNVDTKMDDGLPGRGKLRLYYWTECSTATASSQLDAAYNLANSNKDCAILFPTAF